MKSWFCLITAVAAAIYCMEARAAPVCAKNPSAGDACTFHAYDYTFSTPSPVDVETTCRAVAELSHDRTLYVFVEDAIWEQEFQGVDETRIANVVEALVDSTPANPETGIFDMLTDKIGAIASYLDTNPNINPNLYLVVHDVVFTSLYPVHAYFRELDYETDEYHRPLEGSNELPVVFLDGGDVDSDERLSDLTKMLADLIHWGFDRDEEAWVKDVIGRAMAVYAGYQTYTQDVGAFAAIPDSSLLGEERSGRLFLDHGATTLFGIYLIERMPSFFFSLWVNKQNNGISGFEEALPMAGHVDKDFCYFLHDWAISNKVDRGEYAYETLSLPSFAYIELNYDHEEPGQELTRSVSQWAASYIDLNVAGVPENHGFEVTFSIDQTIGINVTAILIKQGGDIYDRRDLTLLAGSPSAFVFEEAGSGAYRYIMLITSMCFSSPLPRNYTVAVDAIPPVDGDEDREEETAIDGDAYEDEADAPEEDEEAWELVVEGGKDCHEINECHTEANSTAEQEECLQSGTAEAQDDWLRYIACISGDPRYNRDEVNCLELDREDRLVCVERYCSVEDELCGLPDPGVSGRRELGGSNCREASGGYGAVFIALIGLLILGFRSGRIRG